MPLDEMQGNVGVVAFGALVRRRERVDDDAVTSERVMRQHFLVPRLKVAIGSRRAE